MESKLKPLGASNRAIPKLGLSKLPKPSGIPAPVSKRKQIDSTQHETIPAKKPKPGPNSGPPVTGRIMGKPPFTNRTATLARQPPVTSNRGKPNNLTSGNRVGRPGLRRASSTGCLATKVTQPSLQARSTLQSSFSSRPTGVKSKIGSIPSRPMTTADKLKDLQQRLTNKEGDLAFKDEEINRLTSDLHEVQELLADKENMVIRNQSTIESLNASVTTHSATIATLQNTLTQVNGIKAQLEAQVQNFQESLRLSQAESQGRAERIESLENDVSELEAKARAHETERRRLHNTIQELKGNIRVFCRVRPLLGEETLGHASDEPDHMNFPEEDPKLIQLEKVSETGTNDTLAGHKKGQKYEFKFDRVFSPSTSQMEVFDEISQLVQSALDGYNVCIFAYGQTGSGKTYTMEGGDGENRRGMIPRAVEQVFQTASELKDKGWQYEFHGQFLEIYNETIRDLLGDKDSNVKHEVKLAGPHTHEVIVTNLKTITVEQENQVHVLLQKAADNRAVAATKCNERSSRSHSVFRLHIKGSNIQTQETCASTLNLVDLAGSERLKESGSEGQRLKETQAINKSLANLGNCIMALANKDNHVPFRNSKLTHLLQNSLGGNSKVLMFVNISPKEENTQETLCSLRFATKVNNCNIGTATIVTKK